MVLLGFRFEWPVGYVMPARSGSASGSTSSARALRANNCGCTSGAASWKIRLRISVAPLCVDGAMEGLQSESGEHGGGAGEDHSG